jgi:hypothetical protein
MIKCLIWIYINDEDLLELFFDAHLINYKAIQQQRRKRNQTESEFKRRKPRKERERTTKEEVRISIP